MAAGRQHPEQENRMKTLKNLKRSERSLHCVKAGRSIYSRVMAVALTGLVSVAALSVFYLSPKATGQSILSGDEPQAPQFVERSETGLYIIRFNEPALASYTGGFPGLRATSPRATGARKLDPGSPESRRYVEFLRNKHSEYKARIEHTIGRKTEVVFEYFGALNGVAIKLDHEEVAKVSSLPGVAAVYPDRIWEMDTDVGPLHIGAQSIWTGNTGTGAMTRGEGIVIGMIDSGINSRHPSFAGTDSEGYTHTNPYGAGIFKGWCSTNPGFCNDKLIAARGLFPLNGNPEDTDGHGTHTAGTAGGNRHTASFSIGITPHSIPIQGVAPRANIVAYKICSPGCSVSAAVAAVNHAIIDDHVDVINFSISGPDDPWNNAVDLAFLDAYNAGIFVAASAGNTGPGVSTINKSAPWTATVAASTINRVIGYELDVTGPTAPVGLQNVPAVPGVGTAITTALNGEIRFSPANGLGCSAFPANFFQNAIALMERGICTFGDKVNNAVNAGATSVLIFNNFGGPAVPIAGLTGNPPVMMIDRHSGAVLRDLIIANGMMPTTISVSPNANVIIDNSVENVVAGFSSRGPSQFDMLKPDFAAPGVNILAAYVQQGGDPLRYGIIQGTSMASPHAAGAGALMKALFPAWTPGEIKSALTSTAKSNLLMDHASGDPATVFEQGHGLIDLSRATNVGLVFDETGANYTAANPSIGGDPRSLNSPSVIANHCKGACSWTRTVKSVASATETYNVTFNAPPGTLASVVPSSFSIGPGETRELTINVSSNSAPLGSFTFGNISIQPAAMGSQAAQILAGQNLPMAVKFCMDDPFVTSSADSGVGSLRQAVINACPNSTITFLTDLMSSPVTLSEGQIVIDKKLTIQGPGADLMTVQNTAAAGTTSRVFRILASGNATITGLTISGGNASGANNTADGGGIFNSGTLEIADSRIMGNHGAGNGGGGIASWGPLTVVNSTISNNTTGGAGGGILIINTDSASITGTTISNNSAQLGGGLIAFATAGSTNVNITNSTVSGNTANTSGGIANNGNGMTANMTINSTTVTNNTVTGATAASGVLNNRIAGSANLTVTNSIVAGNTGGGGQIRVAGTAVTTSGGHNLVSDNSLVGIAGDLLGTAPMLGPLANNGGPTMTHLLLAGSPAIDNGKNTLTLLTDQRGTLYVRTSDDPLIPNAAGGDGTDIGAVETQPAPRVSVSGQVATSDGRGLRGATVSAVDNQGRKRTAVTSSLGFYSFDDVEAGETLVIAVASKRYRFQSRVLQVFDTLSDVDFVGLE